MRRYYAIIEAKHSIVKNHQNVNRKYWKSKRNAWWQEWEIKSTLGITRWNNQSRGISLLWCRRERQCPHVFEALPEDAKRALLAKSAKAEAADENCEYTKYIIHYQIPIRSVKPDIENKNIFIEMIFCAFCDKEIDAFYEESVFTMRLIVPR